MLTTIALVRGVDRRLEIGCRQLEGRGTKGHVARDRPGQGQSDRIGVIGRLDQYHSVPGFEKADEGRRQSFGAP